MSMNFLVNIYMIRIFVVEYDDMYGTNFFFCRLLYLFSFIIISILQHCACH